MDHSLPQETCEALLKTFAQETDAIELVQTLEQLRAYLIHKIDALLERNMSLLMSALYRIDVSEKLVMQTFEQAPPKEIAAALADLIIERQMQKIQTRKMYKEPPTGSTFEA